MTIAFDAAAAAVARRDLDTPLGALILARSDRGLVGVWFHDQKHMPPRIAPEATAARRGHDPLLDDTEDRFADYFAGDPRGFDGLALDLIGTEFQRRVWALLLEIRRGQTSTYGTLARRLGTPSASRAIGHAVGRNPISVIVPCHRVVGQDGSLTGYAGGLPRKTALLQLERAPAVAAGTRQSELAFGAAGGTGG